MPASTEVVIQAVGMLAQGPKRMADLLAKRDAAREELYRALDRMKEIEVEIGGQVAAEKERFANEAARNAETARRLKANQEWLKLRDETVPAARKELEKAETALERLKLQHQADIAVLNFAAALYSHDPEQARRALEAYFGAEEAGAADAGAPADEAPEPPAPGEEKPQAQQAQEDAFETGTFTVLEARQGKSEGTVRAWCEGPGGKVAVYGKNGNGQALAGAVGRKVEVRFRRGDKGLIAVAVRPVA